MDTAERLDSFTDLVAENSAWLKTHLRREAAQETSKRRLNQIRDGLGALAVLADPRFQTGEEADEYILHEAEALRQKLLLKYDVERGREEAQLNLLVINDLLVDTSI